MPAEPRAGIGPPARPEAGPDQEMAASSEMRGTPQPNVSSVATRGPPPCFSLLIKGAAFLPAGSATPNLRAETRRWGRKKREEGGEERGRKPRKKEGARKSKRGQVGTKLENISVKSLRALCPQLFFRISWSVLKTRPRSYSF